MIATPDRAFPAIRVLLIPGLLAFAILLAPPCFAEPETDDPKEPGTQAASGDPNQAGGGKATGPDAKSGAGQGKTAGGKRPAAAQQKGGPTSTPATTPSTPKAPPAAPLRFDDDDLKAYRKPVVDEAPVDEPAAAPLPARPAAAAAAVPAAPGSPVAAKPASTSPPAKGSLQTSPTVTFAPSPAVLNPPKRKKPPAPPDPLAPFKQREAREQFRAGQIQEHRDRIGALQSRLDYLREKRTAILAPLNFAQMPQGQTDEDRQKDASLKPRELLEQLEIEIASTEKQLEETRTALAEIELRFGAEAGIR